MRGSLRLLARYLEPGAPTGLTGLPTHHSPRSTLLYLYATTLEKLQQVPAHSVYRQSVEAVTKHRMAIAQAVEPEGFAAWQARAKEQVAAHVAKFGTGKGPVTGIDGRTTWQVKRGGRTFLVQQASSPVDERELEWDGEDNEGGELEGVRTEEEREQQAVSATRTALEERAALVVEPEPQLTVEQIEEIETKIGAGLIEEVIEVAEGEAKLVDVMLQSKPWESLEEKPAEGQWTYFERN